MVAANPSSITSERIRYLFDYNPETGDFIRRVDYGTKGKAGTVWQGNTLTVDDETHKTARYIWLHYYGEWPPLDVYVDHEDRIRAHNWILNLRLVTPTQNQQNKAGMGTYAKGVTWRDRKHKPWQARIRINGFRLHLGSFETEEEAAEAYQQACLQHHGEFACLE